LVDHGRRAAARTRALARVDEGDAEAHGLQTLHGVWQSTATAFRRTFEARRRRPGARPTQTVTAAVVRAPVSAGNGHEERSTSSYRRMSREPESGLWSSDPNAVNGTRVAGRTLALAPTSYVAHVQDPEDIQRTQQHVRQVTVWLPCRR